MLISQYPYLTDKTFLKEMDLSKLKEQYVKITVLDWAENPIKDIQGKVINGNLNLDGQSSMRRTANLDMTVEDSQETNITSIKNLISINKKIKVAIGLKNTTNKYINYPIIWYPLGLFVIINASISRSLTGTNISIQLKDKMCLLNGECGGRIPASTQFDMYETIDEKGNWIITKPVIVQIIRELVNHFGGEQLSKILISDLDNRVKQVMRWIGSEPLYGYPHVDENTGKEVGRILTLDESKAAEHEGMMTFKYGEDVGFIYTDFTFPKELVGNAGTTVTEILDQIKGVLGNFEYFYDVEGNFIFQEIKNYLNTSKAKIEIDKITSGDYFIDNSNGKSVYEFNNSLMINSYSNSPQYNLIKNDYVVWGMRRVADSEIKLPIRFHLAIDEKPKVGNEYQVFYFVDGEDNLKKCKCAIPYDSYEELAALPGAAGTFYSTPDPKDSSKTRIYLWEEETYKKVPYPDETIAEADKNMYVKSDITTADFATVKTTDWRSELYLQGTIAEPLGRDSNYYYTELNAEWPKLYDIEGQKFFEDVERRPSGIDFYLDFVDTNSKIAELSVSNIGRRTIVVNDDNINCVFESDIPDYVFIETGKKDTTQRREECEKRNQRYIQVESDIYKQLAIGGMSNSAYNKVRELLYQNTSYNESITLQSIPVYYLEPNTRITVNDTESDIYGDYMISKISMPLGIEGTMSISAIRALERV